MNKQPIGIFDSGLGGLTVASALRSQLPKESIVYLGDTARVPYGTKSANTVVQYARRNMAFMRAHNVKAVVVACNTVSAQGLDSFTHADDPPVLGVIEPGAQAALSASQTKKIAVLATPGTIATHAYPHALRALNQHVEVEQIPCPLLVPLAEEGWTNHKATELIVETYLEALINFGPDTIILGCTHYPILQTMIESVAHRLLGETTQVINSATAVATLVADHLERTGLLSEKAAQDDLFCATDVSERSQIVASRFWSREHPTRPNFIHVDLPN